MYVHVNVHTCTCTCKTMKKVALEVTTRRLPSGKDESRAATLKVTKKTRNSNSQQSAIKSDLWVSGSCRELYREDVFSVLALGRSVLHLSVFQALYSQVVP